MIYKFAGGAHLPKDMDPQAVGERLAHLRSDLGSGFRPAAVVDDASDPSSPLHRAFTWDDGEAARKRREDEARYLIRHVVVIREPVKPTEHPQEVRAFVSVIERESEEGRYMPVVQAMSDADYRDQLLSSALSYFISGRKRYAEFHELARIFAAIDREEQRRELKKAA